MTKIISVVVLDEDEYPHVLYTGNTDNFHPFELVLMYAKSKKVKSILSQANFDPLTCGEGLYLVADTDKMEKFILYSVGNTGYFRNYYEFEKIERVAVCITDILNPKNIKSSFDSIMQELILRKRKIYNV